MEYKNAYLDHLNAFSFFTPRYRDSPFDGLAGGKGSGIDDLLSSKSTSAWDNEFEKNKSSSGVRSSSSLGNLSSNKGMIMCH